MSDLILDNIYLILLLPFWIFLIVMCGRFFSVYVNKKIIYVLTLLSSLLGIIVCSITFFKLELPLEQNFSFLKIGDFSIYFGIQVDKLSLIFALVLFVISFLVQSFSISYMKNEQKQYRFYAYLNMFNFVMAGLFFSPNLYQMYFFWELAGIMSYLLIGFDYKNLIKSEASRRAFLVNRFGDTALLGGIILSSYLVYNYSGNLSFATLLFEDMNVITTIISAYTSLPLFICICLLFIIASAVKSAQFPFYTWLQDAMEAKLPVSALLHSATVVSLGVFLLIRLVPLFTLEVPILQIIAWLGIITALVCSILAAIETVPKKVLAYSTSANFGLIFFAIGILNIKAALILFTAHALVKSMLFLLLDEKENYVNYVTFMLGALTLSGMMFSGLIAKEYLFAQTNNTIFAIFICLISFLTSFYIIRLALIMVQNTKLVNKINIVKYLPIAFLFIVNIGLYFYVRENLEYKVAEPFWSAFAGWLVVYILYIKHLLIKFDRTPNLLETFYDRILVKWYDNFSSAMYYIDSNILSNYKPIIFITAFCVRFVGWFENNVIDKTVSFTANVAKKLSEFESKIQTKNIQSYNAYAFILITVVISLVIISYTMILSQIKL